MEKTLQNYEDRISAIQIALDEDQPFVDLFKTKHGYYLTVGDNDYHTSIALTEEHLSLLADEIAEVMVPRINEHFLNLNNE